MKSCKYTQKQYNSVKSRMRRLVKKHPSTRTSHQQSQINKLGNKLNKMDDSRYSCEGRWFK